MTAQDDPVVPPPSPRVNEVFIEIAEMPRFPGCEDIRGSEEEKEICAQEKMMNFFYRHLKYPATAQEIHLEGIVEASFIVEPDGSISNEKIEKRLSPDCDEEVLRVLRLMREKGIQWVPGGRALRVLIPVSLEFSEEVFSNR
ncbi:MAG: hypothetical protein GYB31_06580 [Bacteroidetes bacterium]|nr:hypothetical protein [Bacteroidota bacterium]